MNDKSEKIEQEKEQKKPDEMGGFYFSSLLKITDPKTDEILVEIRGDN